MASLSYNELRLCKLYVLCINHIVLLEVTMVDLWDNTAAARGKERSSVYNELELATKNINLRGIATNI